MRRKNVIKLLSLLTLFSGIATVTGVLAWYVPKAKITPDKNNIHGSTEGAYFAYGNGSSTNKYGITQPRHLYNLAWLTYLGYFNDKPQMYFELADNIDMTGWALPPIGTEFNPFVGNFDGQGYVISNLTTTNNYSEFGRLHPAEVTEATFNLDDGTVDKHPNVIGFFGVVGNLDDKYGGTYDSSINEIKNFGLKGTTVKTNTLVGNTDSLIGIVAGYVNATTKDIAVDSSTITIGAGTTAFNSSLTSKLSDFGLVGYSENKQILSKMTENLYGVNITNVPEFSASDQGSTAGFGGSIDMYKLYQRILSAKNNTKNGTNGWTNSTSGNYVWRRNITSSADHIETETGTETTTNILTYVSGNEFGTYSQYNRTNNPADQWLYLLGGYNRVTEFNEYYSSAKITDGSGHYMTCTNLNSGTISNTNNAGNAISWIVPSKSVAEIYTLSNNNTKYYLTISGNGVVLQTNEAQRTMWTREDDGHGKVRFTNGNRYLDYTGGSWTLSTMPTKPPVPGNEPTKPNTDFGICLEGSRQIVFDGSGGTRYADAIMSGNNLSSSAEYTPGWFFSNSSLNNGGTTQIYTTIDGVNHYLWAEVTTGSGGGCGGGTTYTYTLHLDTTNAQVTDSKLLNWTIGKSGNFYTFSVKHSGDENTRYLHINGDTLDVSTINSSFSIIDPFEEYTQYLEDYAAWKAESEAYDTGYASYLSQLEDTFTLTLSGETSATSATYVDEENENIDRMVYTYTNTNYIPLNVIQDGSFTSMSNYMPKENNTGYIISGTKLNASETSYNPTVNSDTRVAYHAISTYLNNNSYGSSQIKQVYTVDTEGVHYIAEDPNSSSYSVANSKYVKYASSFAKLQETLVSGGSNVYGLHFMSSKIDKKNIVNVPKVKLSTSQNIDSDDKTFTNYDLPVGSIEFNLADNGYVNFFGGSFYSSGTVDTFFSLHKIFRDSSNHITDIKEIQNIYSDDNLDHSYIIEYKGEPKTFSKPFIIHEDKRYNLSLTDSQSYEDSNLYEEDFINSTDYIKYSTKYSYHPVFNTDWITNYSANGTSIKSLTQKYLYYFEIPVNYGEYCLGPVEGGSGGYLLYLDIGANASKINRTTMIEHVTFNEDVMEHPLGMAIVDMPNETYAPKSGSYVTEHNATTGAVVTDRDIDVNDEDSVCIAITVGYSGDFIIERTANDVALTKAVSTASNGKLVYTGDEIESVTANGSDAELECTKYNYDIVRLTYYDYNVSEDDVTATVIADITRNSETVRQAYQIIHYGTDDQEVITNPSNMNVFKDDGGLYRYSSATGTFEFLDRSILPISSSETTVLISFRTKQDITLETSFQDDPEYNLIVALDSSLVNEYYYLVNGYQIILKPKGTEVEVTILSVADDGDYVPIYFGTIDASNLIASDDEGRVITIDVVP